MKKIVPHILFFLLTITTYSQGVFFNLGKNFSSLSYKNKSSFTEKLRINGVGDAYELGYTDVLKYKNFKDLKYTGSITINDFNAIAESDLNKLEWKTTYLGVQSTVDYQFYDAFFFENPEHYNKFWFVLHKYLAMPAARKSKFILTITNHSLHKINLLAGIPLEKLICIYLAPKSLDQVGANENDTLLSQFIHTNYILHVGVMEKRKNVLKLIEAFYLLIKQGGIYADFKLVLGGTGTGRAESDDTNNILLLIQQLNLQDKVILTGFLTDQQLKTAYEKAYMYVFPSLNEGFGIPVLEAFKANIPVIVANNSCLPEVGGEAVMSFSPYDANELLDKMKLLIDNPALRLEFIKKGQTRLAYFSWEKATNELLAVFERAAQ